MQIIMPHSACDSAPAVVRKTLVARTQHTNRDDTLPIVALLCVSGVERPIPKFHSTLIKV